MKAAPSRSILRSLVCRLHSMNLTYNPLREYFFLSMSSQANHYACNDMYLRMEVKEINVGVNWEDWEDWEEARVYSIVLRSEYLLRTTELGVVFLREYHHQLCTSWCLKTFLWESVAYKWQFIRLQPFECNITQKEEDAPTQLKDMSIHCLHHHWLSKIYFRRGGLKMEHKRLFADTLLEGSSSLLPETLFEYTFVCESCIS